MRYSFLASQVFVRFRCINELQTPEGVAAFFMLLTIADDY
jgi:hypothetical protein